MRIVLPLGLIALVQAAHDLHHTHSGSLTNVRRGSATDEDALTATAAASCEKYEVKSGDTCSGIGKSTGATWAQLISWNFEINKQCSNLDSLVGEKICVSNPRGNYGMATNTISSSSTSKTSTDNQVTTTAPVPSPTLDGTNSRCGEYYKIGANEDCSTVQKRFKISKSDFLFLNPEVFSNCTNLQKSVYYCVKPVGKISTYSNYGGSATSTPTFSPVSMTEAPFPTYLFQTGGGGPVIPIAEGSRKDCVDYDWFPELDYPNMEIMLDCWMVARFNDITPEEFILWNPSLDRNDTQKGSASKPLIPSATNKSGSTASASLTPTTASYNYPCTVALSTSYCVAISTPSSS